jgi:hypothetical protein
MLASAATLFGQKNKPGRRFPFQIIYAENTKTKTGLELKSFDLVKSDDTLTVGDHGMLSMIHNSGISR